MGKRAKQMLNKIKGKNDKNRIKRKKILARVQ